MSALLLIRSVDDMGEAIRAANMLLLHHRQRGAGALDDDVLGIWIRRELDAGLPAWPGLDPEPGRGTRAEPTTIEVVLARGQAEAEAGVFIRESFGISGVWRLCSLDGVLLRTAYSPMQRRQVAIEALVRPMSASRASDDVKLFFFVFGASERGETYRAKLAELQSSWSTRIGRLRFIYGAESGIVFAEERDAWCN